MENVLISRCLLGENVRYDGDNQVLSVEILEQLKLVSRLIPICPEVAGGLLVPRDPCEIISSDGKTVLAQQAKVMSINGYDCTANFITEANNALELVQQYSIKIAILKEDSTSCGTHHIY